MLNTEHFINGQGSRKFGPFHHHQPHLAFTKPKNVLLCIINQVSNGRVTHSSY